MDWFIVYVLGDACLKELSCLMVSFNALSLRNDINPVFGLLQVMYQFALTAMQVASTVRPD